MIFFDQVLFYHFMILCEVVGTLQYYVNTENTTENYRWNLYQTYIGLVSPGKAIVLA